MFVPNCRLKGRIRLNELGHRAASRCRCSHSVRANGKPAAPTRMPRGIALDVMQSLQTGDLVAATRSHTHEGSPRSAVSPSRPRHLCAIGAGAGKTINEARADSRGLALHKRWNGSAVTSVSDAPGSAGGATGAAAANA